MKLPEGDEFYEPFLRFRIVKPPAWQFMPPAWSPAAQLKNDPDNEAWVQHAALPFVTFMQRHGSDDHAYPTVQANARPVLGDVPDNALARQILDSQLDFFRQTWSDLEVVQATTDAVVAGYRANVIVADFSLLTEREGKWRTFRVRSRAYLIMTPGIAFNVGMSSSTDERYYREGDFEATLRSISIG